MVVWWGVLRLFDGPADFFPRLIEVLVQGSVSPFRFYFGVRQRLCGVVFRLFGGLVSLLTGVLVLGG